MQLPPLSNLKLNGKRVLLRLDLDVPVEDGKVLDDSRLRSAVPTIKYLQEHKARQIIILGHRGRPADAKAMAGKPKEEILKEFSLGPVGKRLQEILDEEIGQKNIAKVELFIKDNLRFDQREDENNLEFVKELAKQGDVYVNDAFGVCHRESASVIGLPKLLPHAAGLHLLQEVENLSRIHNNPKQPVVFVIAGGKMDKAVFIEKFLDHAEFVLVGGALAQGVKSYCREKDGRMCIVAAHVTPDGKDITPDSARNFVEIIRGAETIVWNGPLGDIDSGFWEGTKIVAEAIAQSPAYKIAGGGDTIHVLQELNIYGKMDYVSMGGGAMLEFLAYGNLPGLQALQR